MLTQVCQRWNRRRDSYRPAREVFDPRAHEVEVLSFADAKAFVTDHHYSGTYPADRFRYGLRDRSGALVGVAVFAVPVQPRSLDVLACDRSEAVVLSRFVLLDHVLANAESWLIARCFKQLGRSGIEGVVSFSDPLRRTSAQGEIVMPGHVGTIYQATNATYVGTSKAERRQMLPDGRLVDPRALAKIRRLDQGWRYAADQLVAHGASPLEEGVDTDEAAAWVRRWVERLCRVVRHPGNHKYAWMLDRRRRRHLPASLPYPKLTLLAQPLLPGMEAA